MKKANLHTVSEGGNMGSESNDLWVTQFNEESTIKFYESFQRTEASHLINLVPVYINSFGGEVLALQAMRDLMKSSHKPVSTIAVSKAMSCGAFLLAAGTKGFRFAAPNTEIMIHQASGVAHGKVEDIKVGAENILKTQKKVFEQLAEDTGTPVEVWEKLKAERGGADIILTPEEAKKLGVIDHIGIPRLAPEMNISLQVFESHEDNEKKLKEQQEAFNKAVGEALGETKKKKAKKKPKTVKKVKKSKKR